MGTNPGANPRYDYLIFIGRFQPLHIGHEAIIRKALGMASKVILLVGSANRPRGFKNPWSFDERREMIEATFSDERMIIQPLEDVPYNDESWLGKVQSKITAIVSDGSKVGLIGFSKDESSYYLKLFPQWELVETRVQVGTLNSTQIRENFFQKAPMLPRDLCPGPVVDYLRSFMMSEEFRYVLAEAEWKREYNELWKGAPFLPHFVTVDNVVTQAGHILLVRRGGHPGKGLLALPGGFVDPRAGDSFENAVKELWEETQPHDQHGRIPMGKLKGFYTGDECRFDHPSRSLRGYTLTTAFRFNIPGRRLLDVNGGDDAAEADWFPIGSLKPEMMFEDHYWIANKMLNGIE